MKIKHTVVADTMVLRVSGMPSNRDMGVLLAEVERVVGSGDRHVVLNLADVTQMGAAGLGELIKICAVVRARHTRLTLSAVPHHIRYLLAVTNLSSFFETADSDRDAIANTVTSKPRGQAA